MVVTSQIGCQTIVLCLSEQVTGDAYTLGDRMTSYLLHLVPVCHGPVLVLIMFPLKPFFVVNKITTGTTKSLLFRYRFAPKCCVCTCIVAILKLSWDYICWGSTASISGLGFKCVEWISAEVLSPCLRSSKGTRYLFHYVNTSQLIGQICKQCSILYIHTHASCMPEHTMTYCITRM